VATTPDLQASQPGDSSRSRRRLRLAVIGTLAVLILLSIWLWRRHSAAEAAAKHPGAPGIALTTATAQKGDINVFLNAIGTVTPVYTVSITSQVSGPVVNVAFREGQLVSKGDSLIEIDPRPYSATLTQAQGILERDQNVLAQARMDLARYRAALARNAVAEQTVDDQEKLVLQDQGTVRNDEGTVQYDALQVQYCHIRAPISGRIGLRLVDPGNLVQANGSTALAVITQIEPITVIFTLSEDSLGSVVAQMRAQHKLAVELFDRTAQTRIASGELTAIDNQIDTTTGTARLRATFDNKDGALFPNQFVNVRLLVNTIHDTTLVPSSTVQQNGQSSFVYVIQNGVAHVRAVKAGVTEGGQTQVDGVTPGELLANSSFDKLQENAHVMPAAPGPSTATAAAAPGPSAP
jgi:multidrug efflux system membrane fusion protein